MLAYIEKFLEYIKYEKGLSANTIAAYKRDLLFFMNSCSASRVPPIPIILPDRI